MEIESKDRLIYDMAQEKNRLEDEARVSRLGGNCADDISG